MKCPKCEYVDAELREDKWIEGDKGKFYYLPVVMKRDYLDWIRDTADLYGCPNCGNVFIDV